MNNPSPRVLIVAEDASSSFGGEAILPLHYFRRLRARGVECWLVVHERNRDEVLRFVPGEQGRVLFLPDTALHRLIWGTSRKFPQALYDVVFGPLMTFITQVQAWLHVRRIVRKEGVTVVHQPTPVSPKRPSVFFALGAPVVMGPLNGNMTFPAAFQDRAGKGKGLVSVARAASHLINLLVPGKILARTLLVANERTKNGLPKFTRGRVVSLVENGVDASLFKPRSARARQNRINFTFAGRLVGWKAVDLLLEAFASLGADYPAQLNLFGDGNQRGLLEARARDLKLEQRVTFHGWVPQEKLSAAVAAADVFVLPSLWECGGAVVLEAMASGVPVIATCWGGPADYLDADSGVLVEPTSREGLVNGLAAAMRRLAESPGERSRLATNALEKVRNEYDWERKIDRILEIYRDCSARR